MRARHNSGYRAVVLPVRRPAVNPCCDSGTAALAGTWPGVGLHLPGFPGPGADLSAAGSHGSRLLPRRVRRRGTDHEVRRAFGTLRRGARARRKDKQRPHDSDQRRRTTRHSVHASTQRDHVAQIDRLLHGAGALPRSASEAAPSERNQRHHDGPQDDHSHKHCGKRQVNRDGPEPRRLQHPPDRADHGLGDAMGDPACLVETAAAAHRGQHADPVDHHAGN